MHPVFLKLTVLLWFQENLSNITIGVLLNTSDAPDHLLEVKILNPSFNTSFEVTRKGELRLMKPLDFEVGKMLTPFMFDISYISSIFYLVTITVIFTSNPCAYNFPICFCLGMPFHVGYLLLQRNYSLEQ